MAKKKGSEHVTSEDAWSPGGRPSPTRMSGPDFSRPSRGDGAELPLAHSPQAPERPPRGQRQVPVEEQRGGAEAEQQEAEQRILAADLAPYVQPQPLLQPAPNRPHPRPHLCPRSVGRAAFRGRGGGHPHRPAAEPHNHPLPSVAAKRSLTRHRPSTLAARAQPPPP